MTRYTDYDPFAWVYNKHWGNTFTVLGLQVMEALMLPHLPAQANILDLCCGTGQLARVLTERGYLVTGLDSSEAMIHYARVNAPNVEFIIDDARYFKLPAIYHGVVSAFDSLNHIMSLGELTAVFCNVFAVLQEGGLFLFDLNMEEGFLMWDDNFGIVENDHVCVVKTSYNPVERIARFDATFFREDNGWQRSDFNLTQTCYSEPEVRSALEAAGFIKINAFAHNEEWVLAELTRDAGRAFFTCQKPSGAKPR